MTKWAAEIDDRSRVDRVSLARLPHRHRPAGLGRWCWRCRTTCWSSDRPRATRRGHGGRDRARRAASWRRWKRCSPRRPRPILLAWRQPLGRGRRARPSATSPSVSSCRSRPAYRRLPLFDPLHAELRRRPRPGRQPQARGAGQGGGPGARRSAPGSASDHPGLQPVRDPRAEDQARPRLSRRRGAGPRLAPAALAIHASPDPLRRRARRPARRRRRRPGAARPRPRTPSTWPGRRSPRRSPAASTSARS